MYISQWRISQEANQCESNYCTDEAEGLAVYKAV